LRVEKTLAAYEAPPLDAAVDEELRSFIAQRKAGMTDQWY
jgi:trimethylamine--corrinoid protein Co-methyltransferase